MNFLKFNIIDNQYIGFYYYLFLFFIGSIMIINVNIKSYKNLIKSKL